MSIDIYKSKGKPAHLAIPIESHHYEAKTVEDQEYKALCDGDTKEMELGKEDNPYMLHFPCEECDKQLDYIKQTLQKPEL